MANVGTKEPRREMILNKLQTCTCGCRGKDPWHRTTYYRVVAKVSDVEGTVRLPMSKRPVRVTRDSYGISARTGRELYGIWIVDRNSIIFDK